MAHVKLKPTKQYPINFNPNELGNVPIVEEHKRVSNDYITSKKLADKDNNDLIILFENKLVFGFDYLHKKGKHLIVEINPVTIFYSNSVMSFGTLEHYKDVLISQSKNILKWDEKTEPLILTHSGMYYQLAINCIINMQATLECFANLIIPADYPYYSSNGKKVPDTINYKLTYVIPRIKKVTFETSGNKKYRKIISKLITLRNDLIHIKPESETNTGYKGIYRELLNFDFPKALLAVKSYINFYEPGLIEECECGKNFYFYSGDVPNQHSE